MRCAEVRDRLAERALGALSEPERTKLDRHLEACAGCRKEARELDEGAETIAWALPPQEPPVSLERRVIGRVGAPRRDRPSAAHRAGMRRLFVGTVAAALVSVLSFSWALAERQHAGDVAKAAAARVQTLNNRIARLAGAFPGGTAYQARLVATPGNQGFGTAVIVSAPGRDDFVQVDVVPPVPNTGPYTVRLQTRSGRILPAGTLKPTTSGDLIFVDLTGDDLSQLEFISVLNRSALPVMYGVVHPYSGSG